MMVERDGDLSQRILDEIRFLPLFGGVDRSTIAELLAEADLFVFERETTLFLQGDPADRFYMVSSGQVALFVMDSAGRESIFDIVTVGHTFGEEAIFDRQPYPFGARVVETSRLVCLPAAPFLACLAKDFRFVTTMMAGMSSHLRFLIQQISDLKLKTTEQRLGSYLLSQISNDHGSAKVPLLYDKKMLASRLGMTPESLSRALAKLRDVGVHGDGGTLVIDDVAQLRAICHESLDVYSIS